MKLHRAIIIVAIGAASLAAPSRSNAAPDDTLGMALLAADVSSTGELVRGSGAISATRSGMGDYVVAFDRIVGNCFPVATLGSQASIADGLISTAQNGNGVTVATFSAPATPADRSFHLVVFCNQ